MAGLEPVTSDDLESDLRQLQLENSEIEHLRQRNRRPEQQIRWKRRQHFDQLFH